MTSEVSRFFDRFDGMKPDPDNHDPLTDDGMREASDAMIPIYQRASERAGVELDDLHRESEARLQKIPLIVGAHIRAGRPLEGVVFTALVNVAIETFLAGALWEQERHLPDLDLEGDL